MGRTCLSCHKDCKDVRGLRRHRLYCPARGMTSPLRHNNTVCQDELHHIGGSSLHSRDNVDIVQEDNEAGEDALGIHGLSISQYLYGSRGNTRRLSMLETVIDFQPAASWSRATVSSAGWTIIDTFLSVEGGSLPAGHVYAESTNSPAQAHGCDGSTTTPLLHPSSGNLDKTNQRLFFPFRDRLEYQIGWWLFKTRLSNAEIAALFAVGGLWSELSLIRSVKTWRRALHQIPYGISNDDIIEQDITVQIPGTHQTFCYKVRYRSILNIIKFLISFPPFTSHLVYAPIRLYKDEERTTPIWNEMWTGSWWWDQQKSLPPGSTLIPVLLASDKTQLTQHHGDKSSHPVYVTIGNLDKETRRAQKRPSKLLLGFLPVIDKNHHRSVGEKAYVYRRTVINAAMAAMVQELRMVEAEGLRLRCADGRIRHCFPVIAGLSLDYEEQAFLAGVKSGQHCVTCRIPPEERQHLVPLERYPLRDHQYSQELIRHIRLNPMREQGGRDTIVDSTASTYSEEMWIDDVTSFMWSFRRANIHEIMHIDILHQCFKGLVHRTLNDWVLAALQRLHGKTEAAALIDERFRMIPAFPNIKRFPSYSTITQWTGVEQKALLRQMVPALAPILPPAMIQFVRAVVDFTLHAQYYSHDGETVSWMEAALARMNVLKESFREYSSPSTGFNIPKLHAITHYPMMIRKFGSADGYDTAMFEAGHKYIIKDWYPLTNKRESFELQIFEHNQRATNMLAMHDLVEFRFPTERISCSRDESAQSTAVSRPLDLDELRWDTRSSSEKMVIRRMVECLPAQKNLWHVRRQPRYWRRACTIAQIVDQPGFLDALAVFVREERRRARGIVSSDIALNTKEPNPAWVNNYLVCVHPSMTCWKSDRDDGTNADVKVRELVRCDPNWQGQARWRRDCVWVQEYPDTADRRRPLQGRLPARLLAIISVLDVDEQTQQQGLTPIYTGAFLDVYSLRDQGKQSRTHGMIEAQRHVISSDRDRRSLGHRRFYHLGLILRSAHLVPATTEEGNVFYINSYVDWDQYTTVFDPDFLAKDAAVVQQISKRHGWVNRSL